MFDGLEMEGSHSKHGCCFSSLRPHDAALYPRLRRLSLFIGKRVPN